MNRLHKREINKLISSKIIFDEPLSKYTTFGIGGPAKCIIYPDDNNELSKVLKFTTKKNISTIFIGSGSNILIWDDGFDGIVISLRKTFKNLRIKSNATILAQSGVMLGTMVKNAMHKNICGLESLVGVPGTLGGALIMNAGAFGSEISNYFFKAKTMDLKGVIKNYSYKDIKFSYRNSTFPKDEILLEAIFKCKKGNPDKIMKDRNNASKGRKIKQPLKYRSAGSIFKNPSNKIAAGYLIDKAGLKGQSCGDAIISNKHANFIINIGNATAKDVSKLIILAKQKVLDLFNINLELEIKLIGFPEKVIKEIYFA
mgnify:CR=1 FL=1